MERKIPLAMSFGSQTFARRTDEGPVRRREKPAGPSSPDSRKTNTGHRVQEVFPRKFAALGSFVLARGFQLTMPGIPNFEEDLYVGSLGLCWEKGIEGFSHPRIHGVYFLRCSFCHMGLIFRLHRGSFVRIPSTPGFRLSPFSDSLLLLNVGEQAFGNTVEGWFESRISFGSRLADQRWDG